MPDFELGVVNIDDTKDTYVVNPFMSVEHLLRLVAERTRLSEFRLVKGKIFLKNEKSLQDYDITPDDTLIMIKDSQIMKRIVQKSEVNMRILPIMTQRPIGR